MPVLRHNPGVRRVLLAAVAAATLPVPAWSAGMVQQIAPQQEPASAPIERRAPQPNARRVPEGSPSVQANPEPQRESQGVGTERRVLGGEHLAQWMDRHSALSPVDQQRALEKEPGFRQLSSQTQQHMLDKLTQLDAMTPEQRRRRIANIEAMESLSPPQRAEVRAAMSRLGSLPPDDRRGVARTFRNLRDLPAAQRMQAAQSGQYGPPLNDGQRSVLMDLLRVEPMLPPPPPRRPPQGPALPPPASAFR